MKSRKVLVVLLALLLVGGFSLSYAIWDNLTATQEGTINIGRGTEIQVEALALAPEGKVLVPSGVVMGDDDVDYVELTYNVKLSREASEDLELSVVESNIKIGGDDTYAGLVNINIDYVNSVNSDDVLVTVTVTLTAPLTQEAYDAIYGQAITFTLTFSAAQ